MIALGISDTVDAVGQFDVDECRRAAGIQMYVRHRRGLTIYFNDTAGLRKFAEYITRDSRNGDLSPQAARACNLAAKKARAMAAKRVAPPCPRCNKNDDAVPATNYGRPTGGWQYRCCNVTTWPKEES